MLSAAHCPVCCNLEFDYRIGCVGQSQDINSIGVEGLWL